ncbi:hypothetical protein CASFOL_001487 [Castilleja foliolosa]|uniref:Uncharacterized protein n=1 Tax=Castilleja foliolosa TaxID=1961234 RepID=A0ABD3EJZ9_9LAMI
MGYIPARKETGLVGDIRSFPLFIFSGAEWLSPIYPELSLDEYFREEADNSLAPCPLANARWLIYLPLHSAVYGGGDVNSVDANLVSYHGVRNQ